MPSLPRSWPPGGSRSAAIIGAGNEEHLCERPRPSLTSIEIGYERIGYGAAQMLERLMRGDKPNGESRIAMPPREFRDERGLRKP